MKVVWGNGKNGCGSFIHVKWMDHFTFDPRLDGIGGRGPPHIFPNRAPTFVNPALHTAYQRKVLATTIDGYKVQRATRVAKYDGS